MFDETPVLRYFKDKKTLSQLVMLASEISLKRDFIKSIKEPSPINKRFQYREIKKLEKKFNKLFSQLHGLLQRDFNRYYLKVEGK